MKIISERHKTLIIIGLFVSAFCLLVIKFYILPKQFEHNKTYRTINAATAFRQTIKPSQVILYLGDNQMTKVIEQKNELCQEAYSILQNNVDFSKNSMFVENSKPRINKSEKGIELTFEPEIDSRLLSMCIFSKESMISNLSFVSKIYIPAIQNKSVYIEGKEGYIQWEIKDKNIFPILEQVKRRPYVSYYTLQFLFNSNSTAIVNNAPVKNFPIYKTTNSLDDNSRENLAKVIFGRKYDYLNKIVETDGKYIYSYNYGQQILKACSSGSIEYINEDFNSDNKELIDNYYTAVDFLAKMDYSVSDIHFMTVIPVKIHGIPAKKFIFLYAFNNLQINSKQNLYVSEVTVIGDDIYKFIGFKRNFSDIILKQQQEVLSALPILENLYTHLNASEKNMSTEEFLDKITDFRVVFFMEENQSLIPCYRVTLREKLYYLDIYTGKIIYTP